MRSTHVLMGVLLLASPCLAQEEYQIRCEVYRFDQDARAKLFAKPDSGADAVRSLGRLRFEASVPCRLGQQGQVSRSRRIPFLTQTTNELATSSSVQFLDVRDSFACTLIPRDEGPEVSLNLLLNDPSGEAAGLPIVAQRTLATSITLKPGTEALLYQGSGADGEEALLVVIVRVTPLTR